MAACSVPLMSSAGSVDSIHLTGSQITRNLLGHQVREQGIWPPPVLLSQSKAMSLGDPLRIWKRHLRSLTLAAPARAEGSPGPAAGAVQAAVLGSVESLAACSGTGAGPAGTPRGFPLLVAGRGVVRPLQGVPEPGLQGPKYTPSNQLTCFCGRLFRYLALLDRTMFGLRASWNSLSGILLFSYLKQTRFPSPKRQSDRPDRTRRSHSCPPCSLSSLFGKPSVATLNTQEPIG